MNLKHIFNKNFITEEICLFILRILNEFLPLFHKAQDFQ